MQIFYLEKREIREKNSYKKKNKNKKQQKMKKKKLKQKNKDNIFSYKKFCNSDFINIIIKISIKLEK